MINRLSLLTSKKPEKLGVLHRISLDMFLFFRKYALGLNSTDSAKKQRLKSLKKNSELVMKILSASPCRTRLEVSSVAIFHSFKAIRYFSAHLLVQSGLGSYAGF